MASYGTAIANQVERRVAGRERDSYTKRVEWLGENGLAKLEQQQQNLDESLLFNRVVADTILTSVTTPNTKISPVNNIKTEAA